MPISVIAVDSHPIYLMGLKQLLGSQQEMQLVETCSSMQEAVLAVERCRPSVVLSEIHFPTGDGLQLIRALVSQEHNLKLVVLTAAMDDDLTVEVLRLGVQGVFLKHMPSSLLLQCIRKVSVGGQWLEKESLGHAFEKLLGREAGARRLATILTGREIEVMCQVAEGLSNREIAERLTVSEGTVKIHVHNIYSKLGISNRVDLTLYAQKKGIV